jgi:hypothetical protein
MKIDASWDASATQYLNMYRYGLMAKRWYSGRHELVRTFMASLSADKEIFTNFFIPASGEYQDSLDSDLRKALLSDSDQALVAAGATAAEIRRPGQR